MTVSSGGFFAGRHPRVIAHRGSSGEAPENTIAAFDLAVAQDADIFEFDVLLSADDEVVVLHDDLVDRTTNGTGAVREMTLAELKKLDAGYKFTVDGGATYPYRSKGVTVPTLEELLERYPQVPLNIEFKSSEPLLVWKTCALLQKYDRLDDQSVLLACFEHDVILNIRQTAPDALSSLSVKETRKFMLNAWLWLPRFCSPGLAFQVAPRKKGLPLITRRFVERAHRRGIEVHPWTIDEPAEMHRLLDLGVDGLISNYPALARKVIESRA